MGQAGHVTKIIYSVITFPRRMKYRLEILGNKSKILRQVCYVLNIHNDMKNFS